MSLEMSKVILKPSSKLFLLMLSIFTISFFITKAAQTFSLSDHFWLMDQILCSMELDDVSTQISADDHPVLPSKASTDLTKPNTSL
uniref:Female-specific orf protein n=1 Tax=Pyganodon grandis TaxID=96932 RepID=F4ZFI6_PYGGR|nr:female-specific orf protein [Pyganodon grandis]AEC14070.1 female-specific orf protein [Pyganodon grandis]AEC14073.1 female-specific orf protein [Pyganodon grandis]AEC14074.1 female-specific orf protein [Pyganodon grandis]AEC14075.1 female-specific orf protein [Pyganodon grandis]